MGDTKGDYKENLLEQVRNIITKVFQMKTDSELFKSIETKFISSNSVKKGGLVSKPDVRKSRSGSLLPTKGQTLTRLLAEEDNAISVQLTTVEVKPTEEKPEIKSPKPQGNTNIRKMKLTHRFRFG